MKNTVLCLYVIKYTLFTLLTICIFASSQILFAHGVEWDFSQKKAYALQFTYDDGMAMSFSQIKVYGPDNLEKLVQEGRTNEFGYFAFIPTGDGHWLVTSDDGTGHLCRAEFDVKTETPEAINTTEEASTPQAPIIEPPAINIDKVISGATKPYKIAVTLEGFLIIGLGYMAFKKNKKKNKDE
ncbi:MAG: hypothetical protein LBE38_10695 [Deltaproteobacteria bacterium]|jgi:hypothetical protein|nr:hypothetical protein [Deltaproteobacteria bacterium]